MTALRRRWILALGAALMLIAAWPTTRLWRTERALRHYRATLAARGEPMTAAELAPLSTPAARQAAAQLASALNQGRPLGNRTDLPGLMRFVAQGLALPATRQDELQTDLGSHSPWPALELEMPIHRDRLQTAIHILARAPALDFDVRYEQGVDLALPHLQSLRDLARLLGLSTALHLRAGDPAAATADLCTLLAAAHACRGEATTVSQWTRVSMCSIAASATWDLLQSDRVTRADLERVQAAWAPLQFLDPMARSLERERLVQHDFYERLRTQPGFRRRAFQNALGASGPAPAPAPRGTVAATATLTGLAEQTGSVLARSGELTRLWLLESLWSSFWAYEDELRALQALQAQLEGLRAAAAGQPFAPILRHLDNLLQTTRETRALNFLQPAFAHQFSSSTRTLSRPMLAETQRRLVTTALALHRYRLHHGSWPAHLDLLIPQFLPSLPLDPYDAQPIRYRPQPDGRLLLYSVGEDAIDQGGDPTPAEGNPNQPSFWRGRDLVWPRPANAAEVAAYLTRRPPPVNPTPPRSAPPSPPRRRPPPAPRRPRPAVQGSSIAR